MSKVIIELTDFIGECSNCNHYPNETTIKAIKDAKNRKGLVTGKEADELAKKLGI